MIATLLASLLGFVGSVVPDIFKIFQDKRDKAHELEILKMQRELQAQGHSERLEEINASADIAEMMSLSNRVPLKTGVRWIDGLNGMVRPVIAFWFMGLFTFAKVGMFWSITHAPADLPWLAKTWGEAAFTLWGSEDQAIFAAVISFYFGSRAMQRVREGKQNK